MSPEPGRQTLPLLIIASSAGQADAEPVHASEPSHGRPAPGRPPSPIARQGRWEILPTSGAPVAPPAAQASGLSAVPSPPAGKEKPRSTGTKSTAPLKGVCVGSYTAGLAMPSAWRVLLAFASTLIEKLEPLSMRNSA